MGRHTWSPFFLLPTGLWATLIILQGTCSSPSYKTVSHHFSHLLSHHAQCDCLGINQWCWTGACFSAPGPNYLFTLSSGLLKKACSAPKKHFHSALSHPYRWQPLPLLTEPMLGQTEPPTPSDDWTKFSERTLALRKGKRKFGKGESSTDAHG